MSNRTTGRRGAVAFVAGAALLACTVGAVPGAGAQASEGPTDVACLRAADLSLVADQAVIPWAPGAIVGGVTVQATGLPHCVGGADDELKVLLDGSWLGERTIDAGTLRDHYGVTVWALPPLDDGQVVTMHADIDFPLTIAPGAWPYEATLQNADGVYAWRDATVQIAPTCADVQLGVTIAPDIAAQGRPTAASVTATNHGTCDLEHPITVEVRGSYLPFVTPTVVDGGVLDGDRWTITTLAPNETASVSWAGTAATMGLHMLQAGFDLAGDPSAGNYAYDSLQVWGRPAILGIVTGFDGAPVAGARVAAFWAGGGWFPVTRATTTAADGTYRLDELPQGGVYKVLITHPSGQFHRHWVGGGESRRQSPGVTALPGQSAVADVVLQPQATQALAVDVTGPDGSARPDVWVTVFDDHGYVAGAVTGPSGTTTIGDLAAGSYWVRAQPLDGITPAEWYLDASTRADATAVPLPIGTMPVAIELDG